MRKLLHLSAVIFAWISYCIFCIRFRWNSLLQWIRVDFIKLQWINNVSDSLLYLTLQTFWVLKSLMLLQVEINNAMLKLKMLLLGAASKLKSLMLLWNCSCSCWNHLCNVHVHAITAISESLWNHWYYYSQLKSFTQCSCSCYTQLLSI